MSPVPVWILSTQPPSYLPGYLPVTMEELLNEKEAFKWIGQNRSINELDGTRDERYMRVYCTCRRDIKKYSFPYRTVDVWNALDREVVEAATIHNFKMKLDNFWEERDGTPRA